MCAYLFLTLLMSAQAATFLESKESKESCSDPAKMKLHSFPDMEKKFKMTAKSADTRWKMKKTLATLTDEEIENCGTCEGIQEVIGSNRGPTEYKLKKIFYINPDFSTARKKTIERKLHETASEYEVERWEAATAKDATRKNRMEFTQKGVQPQVLDNKYGNGRATIAVYLSHARLLKHIHETDPDGEDVYAIFEDDAEPPENWTGKALGLLNTQVPEDWDIFKFGYFKPGTDEKHITPCVKESRGEQYGMQAYFVRPKSIPKILEQLASLPLYDVDGALHGGNKQAKKMNKETGKEEFSTKGLVLYTSAQPIVKHAHGESQKRVTNIDA